MKLATNNPSQHLKVYSVLIDFGRYSNSFDYIDGNSLGVEIGDIVLVKIKGRVITGLVMEENFLTEKFGFNMEFKYSFIERIIQKKVFYKWWRDWIEDIARGHKVNIIKMFKTALPPGWFSKSNVINKSISSNFWILITPNLNYQSRDLTNRQLLLIQKINSVGGLWQSDLIKIGFSSTLINSLIKKNLIKKISRSKIDNLPLTSFENNFKENQIPLLTDQQKEAILKIKKMKEGESLLLWGETGSGKTEIYLRITKSFLEQNKSCLIMAPEIGLIPQLVDRFSNRFKKNIFEYHSNCSSKQRQLVWRKTLDDKEPLIVIGTRSSIFLPVRNLGVIIIDEEHDNSYKQETPMPCYDARELALDRAKRDGVKIIFGSATPSLNTWKQVKYENKFKLARMKERISIAKVPEIKVIDMRDEFKKGNKKIFSKELFKSLRNLKEKKEQAIILVPRRGYNGFLSCRNCGFVVNCPNCDTALTVHIGIKGKKWLNCHWCDFKSQFINVCPDCHSNAFKPFGIGTQKVVESLKEEMPELKLLRFDRDTTSGKEGHRKILSEFSKGNADVIIGTQMLAKGIDIPNVTLSVVLASDSLLNRPDLATEEKALQLFLQLAGRSGRANKEGEVILQTYQPSHPVISFLKKRDYESFLNESLKLRKDLNLFPFCRVCLLKISGFDNALTEETANKLSEYLTPLCLRKKWSLIGPAPGMIPKIGKKFRWQILIYGPDKTELPIPTEKSLWDFIPINIFLTIDVNPVEI